MYLTFWLSLIVAFKVGQGCVLCGDFYSIGSCSKTCGEGIQKWIAKCFFCTEEVFRACNIEECSTPINGNWGGWSAYETCDKSCGKGTKTRTRVCDNPSPQHGGSACPGASIETQPCNLQSCPTDGKWTKWTPYSTCSKTCGSGVKTKTRTCTNPAPSLGGASCVGDSTVTKDCNTKDCPKIDGKWANWSDFTVCSQTCDTGTQSRYRICSSPSPENGGSYCKGDSYESKSCEIKACAIDGMWTNWSEFGECSQECGPGTQSRARTCSSPSPQNGGSYCQGESYESKSCNIAACAVDGNWSNWGDFGKCSKSCELGTQLRSRICNQPENGGEACKGESTDTRTCNPQNCPIDGSWGNWGSFGECSKSCELGTQERSRICNEQEDGGETCKGESIETQSCNPQNCPIDGSWGNWGDFGECSKSCELGSQIRSRICNEPADGGETCRGEYTETQSCNPQNCPIDGSWGNWGDFGECSKSCELGTQERSRICNGPEDGGEICQGESTEIQSCNPQKCPIDGGWGNWGDFGECSKSCELGSQMRSRICNEQEDSGETCQGESTQIQSCNPQNCPIDGSWGNWGDFGECSKSCELGSKMRSRICNQPKDGGETCQGEFTETQTCNPQDCEVDCQCSEWGDFESCSISYCGVGVSQRKRSCEKAVGNGKTCSELNLFDSEKQMCVGRCDEKISTFAMTTNGENCIDSTNLSISNCIAPITFSFDQGQLKSSDLCVTLADTSISLRFCSPNNKNQMWEAILFSGNANRRAVGESSDSIQFRLANSEKCIAVFKQNDDNNNEANAFVSASACLGSPSLSTDNSQFWLIPSGLVEINQENIDDEEGSTSDDNGYENGDEDSTVEDENINTDVDENPESIDTGNEGGIGIGAIVGIIILVIFLLVVLVCGIFHFYSKKPISHYFKSVKIRCCCCCFGSKRTSETGASAATEAMANDDLNKKEKCGYQNDDPLSEDSSENTVYTFTHFVGGLKPSNKKELKRKSQKERSTNHVEDRIDINDLVNGWREELRTD